MELSKFIQSEMEDILTIWEHDAKETLKAHDISREEIRDHLEQILQCIAAQLERPGGGRNELSVFNADHPDIQAYASIHGQERFELGLEVNQLTREFQSLRMTVMELWAHSEGDNAIDYESIIRFNYEMDRVVEKSIERYAKEKQKQTRLFETMLSSLADPCYILSLQGNFRYANKAMAELCDLSVEEIKGKAFSDMPLPPRYSGPNVFAQVLQEQQQVRGEVEIETSGGEVRTYEAVHSPVIDKKGELEAISGIAHDITYRKDSEAEIWHHANYDPVTEIPNRRLFRDRLAQHAAHSERTGDPFALLFVDLDKFKEINDRLGHDAGDVLLRKAAERIDACIRHSDTVARIGGDEFTVLILDTGDRALIESIAGKILAELKRPFKLDQDEINISGSIGITLFPEDASSDEQLLNYADEAMYLAKRSGRNQICFFNEIMRKKRDIRHGLIEELREAKNNHQLKLYFQPVFDLSDGSIAKAEALMRWQHPDKGLMLPGEFLELAEQTGLMTSLQNWVFAEAAEHLKQWKNDGVAPAELTINASPMQLMHDHNSKSWEPYLKEFARIGTDVAIELTENVFLQDTDHLAQRFSELKNAGIKLVLDDFGTGYSSLAYLTRFDVDYLKIDQTFIRDSHPDSNKRAIAETIVFMAHKLGLKVVAEGVETQEQHDWLKALGCDFAQGFLFSKPLSAGEFGQLLKSGSRH